MSQVLGNPLDELRLRTDFQGQPTLSQTGNTILLIGNVVFPIRKMPHSPPRDRPPHRAAESGFPPRFANGHAHEYSSTRFMPDRKPPGISILLHGGNDQLQSGGTGEGLLAMIERHEMGETQLKRARDVQHVERTRAQGAAMRPA